MIIYSKGKTITLSDSEVKSARALVAMRCTDMELAHALRRTREVAHFVKMTIIEEAQAKKNQRTAA